MDLTSLLAPLGGGVLLGAAAVGLLVFGGRVAGVSGILGGAIAGARVQAWRIAFVAGLVLAGLLAALFVPGAVSESPRSLLVLLVAGLLVGIGTRVGGGCTSGHGVCGIGRLSKRSLAATLVFMATGALMASAARVVIDAIASGA